MKKVFARDLSLFPLGAGYPLFPLPKTHRNYVGWLWVGVISSLSTLRKICNIQCDVIFVLTSALWSDDVIVWEYIGKWRMTSRNDVITSETHQNCRKCLYYQYLTCVQIWSDSDNILARYTHIGEFHFNMKVPIYFLPTPD